MGGLKRKISMVKIEDKNSRAVACSKRTKGLYSKASELCLLSDAQIAIITTPVSSNSNVSFYTFGHSSVDNVVSAFLANQRPGHDLGLGFWWEDESLAMSEDPEELRDAIDSMSKMLQHLKEELRVNALQNQRDCDDVKKKGLLHETHQNIDFKAETKSACSSMNSEMNDVSMVTANQNQFSVSDEAVVDGELVVHRDLYNEDIFSDLDEDLRLTIFDYNNNNNNNLLPENLDEFNQVLDLDQLIDFETNYGSLMGMNGVSETVEDGGSVIQTQRDLDDDNLCFSDYFNEAPI